MKALLDVKKSCLQVTPELTLLGFSHLFWFESTPRDTHSDGSQF